MALLNFSINGDNQNPTRFAANARNFKIIVDEPAELGGTNDGPNPVEYLLAGYAGCLNVVGNIVAREQGLAIKKLSIEVDGDINPDRLFGISYDDRAGFKKIRVNISLDTDAEQITVDKWFKEVERRCPINDNLTNPTPVEAKVGILEYELTGK